MRRSRLPLTILVVALTSGSASAQVSSPSITVRGLMTPQEFQQAGLGKLTPEELAALDAWFLKTAGQLVTALSPTGNASPARGPRALDFSALEGAIIVAEDGTFLGKITTNSVDPQSIANDVGRYGGSISSTSIFNEIGRYGGEIAPMSPFNTITSTPPRIFKGNRFIAYLTVNTTKNPRVDPRALIGWLKANP